MSVAAINGLVPLFNCILTSIMDYTQAEDISI